MHTKQYFLSYVQVLASHGKCSRTKHRTLTPHAHCCCADIIRAGCLVRDIDVTYPFASYATSSNFSKHKSRQKLDSKKISYNNNKFSREKMLLLCYVYLMENNLNNAKYKILINCNINILCIHKSIDISLCKGTESFWIYFLINKDSGFFNVIT